MFLISFNLPLQRKNKGQGHDQQPMNLVVWLLLILPTVAWTLQGNSVSTIKGCWWITGHVCASRVYLVFLGSHGIDLGLAVLGIFGWVLQVLLVFFLHRKHQKSSKTRNKNPHRDPPATYLRGEDAAADFPPQVFRVSGVQGSDVHISCTRGA